MERHAPILDPGCEYRLNDVVQVHRLPCLAGQEVVRLGKRKQSAIEGFGKRFWSIRAFQTLIGKGLHGRKRVLHTMIELADQQLLALLRPALLGSIPEDLEVAIGSALFDWKHDARTPETGSILAVVPAFVGCAALFSRLSHFLFGHIRRAVLRAEEDAAGLTKNLGVAIAEKPFGATVPARNPPGTVEGDDCVLAGTIEDDPQPLIAAAKSLFGSLVRLLDAPALDAEAQLPRDGQERAASSSVKTCGTSR